MTAATLLFVSVLGLLAASMVLVYHLASAALWGVSRVLRGVVALGRHLLGFVKEESIDAVQTLGAAASSVAIAPLAAGNLLIGRWSSVRQYGRALGEELTATVGGVYRLTLANPLRLLGLGSVVQRVEGHLPEPILRGARSRVRAELHHAPNVLEPPRVQRVARAARASQDGFGHFEGYDVVGELPAGGSGARLFLARPHPETVARLREAGLAAPGEVVVKAFAIGAGSTLPQIVREGRALEAARRLGLVLQHSLDEERFWYVMPYVRGRELGDVATALHVRCGAEGLDDAALRKVAGYTRDVLVTLERFHEDGLWHKDVKPSNVVVTDDEAHLVDLGLVTPLASAMTLTTHGTEYYRDPELVRQALRGAKVNEVDGVKFDLYAVGALLYSMVENSFPAHGNLSRLTKRCPEALSFVVRRAMADHADRYASAAEMRADLEVVAAAAKPFDVLPVALPSFRRAMQADDDDAPRERPEPAARVLRVAADAPRKEARAAGNSNADLAGRERAEAAHDERRARKRHRRRHGLATFALMACGLVFVGRILPVIAEGTDVAGARGGESRPSGWFGDRVRSGTVLEPSHQLEVQRVYADAAEAIATAERAHAEAVVSAWRAELSPLLRQAGATGLPSWSRGGHVLVLDDVRDADLRADLEPVATALEEAGYAVVGSALHRAESDLALELEASARHALGLADGASMDAVTRLQEFLEANHELDAVLWLAPDPGGEPERRLLLPRGVRTQSNGAIQVPNGNVVGEVVTYGAR